MNTDYDPEMLQQINDNADLVSYVSETMELKKRGDDYYAHCPAHVDLTPSLSFNAKDNFYYCFSCGRSGRFIGYLMDYEGMSFDDAVAKAARIAGVDTSKMCASQTIRFLKKVKQFATKTRVPYNHAILPNSEYDKYADQPAQEWIDEGIDPGVMKKFGIRLDKRMSRIIYPVRDIRGRLINIKGRTRYKNYKALKIPKYINYFEVGVLDYLQGLDITLPDVMAKGEIIIFESIKSVMKVYGWGYKNAASAEKHTLTDEQVDLLIQLRVNVVLAYDNDVSYRDHAVWSSIDKLRRITNVFVINDMNHLLGDASTKNSPADCGREIWETLYAQKRKVV